MKIEKITIIIFFGSKNISGFLKKKLKYSIILSVLFLSSNINVNAGTIIPILIVSNNIAMIIKKKIKKRNIFFL